MDLEKDAVRIILVACLAIWSGPVAAQSPPAGEPLVFFTIFGPQGETLQNFYRDVFGWNLDSTGRFETRAITPLSGQIGGPGAPEALLYIGVSDVTATLKKAESLGGTIRYPRFEVPGVAVLGILKDPAGNSIGLVEMQGGKAKVPAPAAIERPAAAR